jgi:hypothetical protein
MTLKLGGSIDGKVFMSLESNDLAENQFGFRGAGF